METNAIELVKLNSIFSDIANLWAELNFGDYTISDKGDCILYFGYVEKKHTHSKSHKHSKIPISVESDAFSNCFMLLDRLEVRKISSSSLNISPNF